MRHNRGLALTVEIHRAPRDCNNGYPRPIRQFRPATRALSPLKTTARRVVHDPGYPHAGASANAITDTRRGRFDRPVILAGGGSSADRLRTLTVEMHSVASRFGIGYPHGGLRWPRSHARVRTGHARHFGRNRWRCDRILPHRPPLAYSRSPPHCAAFRVACERGDAPRNPHVADHAPALAVKMHGLSGDSRNRISTSRHARGSAKHARVRLECATPRTTQRPASRARKGASPERTPPSPLNSTVFRVVSWASCPQPASCVPYHPVTLTCEMHRAPSRFGVRISTTDRATRLSSDHRPGRPAHPPTAIGHLPESPIQTASAACSPFKCTVFRVASGVGYPHLPILAASSGQASSRRITRQSTG